MLLTRKERPATHYMCQNVLTSRILHIDSATLNFHETHRQYHGKSSARTVGPPDLRRDTEEDYRRCYTYKSMSPALLMALHDFAFPQQDTIEVSLCSATMPHPSAVH